MAKKTKLSAKELEELEAFQRHCKVGLWNIRAMRNDAFNKGYVLPDNDSLTIEMEELIKSKKAAIPKRLLNKFVKIAEDYDFAHDWNLLPTEIEILCSDLLSEYSAESLQNGFDNESLKALLHAGAKDRGLPI